MKLSNNDKDALKMILSQIKDFEKNNGKFRRGYMIVSNDEYHRLIEILNIIESEALVGVEY